MPRQSRHHLNGEATLQLIKKPMHLLLADDEPMVLDIVGKLLRNAGHTVEISRDGEEAREAFQRQTFDIVFTDLAMPKLDGLGLAKWIKATAPDQRVVLLTGSGDDGILPPNVDYVLEKPVRCGPLVDTLRRLGR
jgi:two-component system, OmpR family, response regulator